MHVLIPLSSGYGGRCTNADRKPTWIDPSCRLVNRWIRFDLIMLGLRMFNASAATLLTKKKGFGDEVSSLQQSEYLYSSSYGKAAYNKPDNDPDALLAQNQADLSFASREYMSKFWGQRGFSRSTWNISCKPDRFGSLATYTNWFIQTNCRSQRLDITRVASILLLYSGWVFGVAFGIETSTLRFRTALPWIVRTHHVTRLHLSLNASKTCYMPGLSTTAAMSTECIANQPNSLFLIGIYIYIRGTVCRLFTRKK